jgi:hypothetical protein
MWQALLLMFMHDFTSSDQGIEDVQEKTVKMAADDWFVRM